MKVLYVTSGNRFYPHSFLDEFITTASQKSTFPMEVFELQIDTDWQKDFFVLVKKFQPEFVFTILGVYFPTAVVDELCGMGIKTAIWCVDDPYDLDMCKQLIYWYDYVFTTERECLQLYRRLGARKVIYLNFGTEVGTYFPENVPEKYASDLCFVGSPYPGRVKLIRQIVRDVPEVKIKVVGPGWENFLNDGIEVIGKSVVPAEVRKFYNGAKINLNFHRASREHISGETLNSMGVEATSPNSRTFDISACRAFQIVDYRPGLKTYFQLEEELVTFQTPEELVAKINHYLAAETEREAIATRAYEKTLKKYQLSMSLKQMLTTVEQEITSVRADLQQFMGLTEGFLVKSELKPAVYLVTGGYKREIPSIEVFNKYRFRWEDVKIVPEREINAIPAGSVLL